MIEVLVADDQAAVLAGLVLILGAAPGVRVVGEAADGAAAVELARELLDMAETTTKTHVSRILGKPGLTSRVQAAILAQETAASGFSGPAPHDGSSGAG